MMFCAILFLWGLCQATPSGLTLTTSSSLTDGREVTTRTAAAVAGVIDGGAYAKNCGAAEVRDPTNVECRPRCGRARAYSHALGKCVSLVHYVTDAQFNGGFFHLVPADDDDDEPATDGTSQQATAGDQLGLRGRRLSCPVGHVYDAAAGRCTKRCGRTEVYDYHVGSCKKIYRFISTRSRVNRRAVVKTPSHRLNDIKHCPRNGLFHSGQFLVTDDGSLFIPLGSFQLLFLDKTQYFTVKQGNQPTICIRSFEQPTDKSK